MPQRSEVVWPDDAPRSKRLATDLPSLPQTSLRIMTIWA